MKKCVRILGTRGIPAAHGGFETFAEHLALYLVEQGWRVVVYCQTQGEGGIFQDRWRGVELVKIPVLGDGPRSTIAFDWRATKHASGYRDLCLTLGYNTAIFCTLLRAKGITNVINMDGIEWARAKWGPLAKAWFWLNDWAACWLGDHLVADHPDIKLHLATRVRSAKITTIPYGADRLHAAPEVPVRDFGLEPSRYLTLIARAEPENSILEVVRGFSSQPRGVQLAVLGRYDEANPYHNAVRRAANSEVRFLGAIYDKRILQALRFHCLAYVHGHQVGGTNPSLVEALGAGNAVIAHDNRFNRCVAGPAATYFSGAEQFSKELDRLLVQPSLLAAMREGSISRFESELTWPHILSRYETLLSARS